MKYAKQWKQDIARVPTVLQDTCLSYKVWKKRCKQVQDMHEAMALLQEECQRVDACFCAQYQRWRNTTSWRCWILRKPLTEHELAWYAALNATTLYKVCKRMAKCYETKDPMEWLVRTRAAHVYAFLGGPSRQHLELTIDGKHPECPLCMEPPCKERPLMIYGCGHLACRTCWLRYAGVEHLRGLWCHVMAYAPKQECPVCAYPRALTQTIALA